MGVIKLDNVIVLDDQEAFAPNLRRYALSKELPNIRAFVATHPNGAKTYLLVDGETPIYEHQQFESCACHIDFLVLDRQFKESGRD